MIAIDQGCEWRRVRLAYGGVEAALADAAFAKGVNTHVGKITCRPVVEALGKLDRYVSLDEVRARALRQHRSERIIWFGRGLSGMIHSQNRTINEVRI